jgi:hypothetical protein
MARRDTSRLHRIRRPAHIPPKSEDPGGSAAHFTDGDLAGEGRYGAQVRNARRG